MKELDLRKSVVDEIREASESSPATKSRIAYIAETFVLSAESIVHAHFATSASSRPAESSDATRFLWWKTRT